MSGDPFAPRGLDLSSPPNATELAALPTSLAIVEKYLIETFPDVDLAPGRWEIIVAFVNVLRAGHAYNGLAAYRWKPQADARPRHTG